MTSIDAMAREAKLEEKLMSKVSLRLIPFMLVLYVISYLDRINISFAALQMNHDLGLSDAAFGFGGGIFFLGYCIFGIPSNLVIQRFGPRRWVSAIMVAWGLMTISFCCVKSAPQFWVLRFFLGVAEAGFFPGMILYLTYWYPGRYYGLAVARFMLAIPVAGLLGSGTAAAALSMQGIYGLAGWMWLFVVTGIPAILFGLLVWFTLPDGPHQARWLSKEEHERLDGMLGTARDTSSGAGTAALKDGFIAAVEDLAVWRCALLYFTLTVSMYGFQLWLPQIIKAFGSTSDRTTALLSSIPALFQAMGMLIVARNSDRTGERPFHLAFASSCTCLGLLVSRLSTIPWMEFAGLCLAAFGIWGSAGPFWALANNSLKRESQATGIAIINSVGNLGGFAGPWIVGLFKSSSAGFGESLIALAVASLLSMALALTARKRR